MAKMLGLLVGLLLVFGGYRYWKEQQAKANGAAPSAELAIRNPTEIIVDVKDKAKAFEAQQRKHIEELEQKAE